MTKDEAIHLFVSRDMQAIPQEWVRIVALEKGRDCEYMGLPMWGTMFIVDSHIARGLKTRTVVAPEDCEEQHAEDEESCMVCEDYEEMMGTENILDKNGRATAGYLYEIDGEHVIGIHGAGWNFYDGLWDKLYDALGLKWHEKTKPNQSRARVPD